MAKEREGQLNGRLLNGRYKIVETIGTGGMAQVYLGHDELLDRNVAIKMLRPEFAADKELLEQFRREAKSVARLYHPYIINIYDVAVDGPDQYIVMEYVQGTTLKTFLQHHKLSIQAALTIAARLANALEHAHNRNIIHCDIKPQNILIDQDLNPKVADFGIAKMISNQTVVFSANVMGSVHYLSPEQASGGKITAASDVYSLGIVLFEMLTDHVPFNGPTAVAVTMMHATQPIPRLQDYLQEVPEGLQEIIDKAMAKKPEQRYENASQLRKDLQALLAKLYGSEEEDYGKVLGGLEKKEPQAPEEGPDEGATTLIMKRPLPSQDQLEAPSDTQTLPLTAQLPTEVRQVPKSPVLEVLTAKLKGNKQPPSGARPGRRGTRRRVNWVRLLLLFTLLVVVISFAAHFFFGVRYQEAEVPNVVNMTVVEAQKTLEAKNFQVKLEESFSNDPAFREGRVMEQSVKAGEKLREHASITLTISRGAELKQVPDVTGMSLVKARTLLEDAGFTIGHIQHKYVKGARIDTVVSTSPKGLEKSPKGSDIDLLICEGDKPVPAIVGKKLTEAQSLLAKAQLTLGKVGEVQGNEPKGTVKSVDPPVGTKLGSGDKVDVTVSAGPQMKNTYVEFVVPGDNKRHEVEIVLVDATGRTSLYKGKQRGGVRIRQRLDYASPAVVSLTCDGVKVEEKSL